MVDIEKVSGLSMDIEGVNQEKLRAVFPECFNDGKLDIDKLLNLCGKYIENDYEKYKFEWPGKSECFKISGKRSTGTLRPCREESVNFDTTKNLYIEGDNLEVLKLLQTSYFNKVKMIYIDPPYNTGNDFVYKDDFKDPIEKYKEITQQTTKSNPETMGRFHTNWLNMMFPRLRLAASLLRDDGVIFISIDDNELINLKKLCDEVFGEENFINIVSINMKNTAGASGGGEDKRLKKNVEYLLLYAKNYSIFETFNLVEEKENLFELIDEMESEGKSWKYTSILINKGEFVEERTITDGMGLPITIKKYKGLKRTTVNKLIADNIPREKVYIDNFDVIFSDTNAQTSIRTRVIDEFKELAQDECLVVSYVPRSGKDKDTLVEHYYISPTIRRVIWLKDAAEKQGNEIYKKEKLGTYWDFVGETKNLTKEGEVVFANGKKPLKLIKRLVEMQTDDNDIILDFFSGSATTAHAVMQVNSENNTNRQFIMVQLPVLCDDSEFKNICEIGKERIRRAGKKLTENTNGQLSLEEKQPLDIGFKVLKLDTSNLAQWDSTPTEEQGALFARLHEIENSVKSDRTDLDVVYEVMLKLGVPLDFPVQEIQINDKKAYSIGENCLVLVCIDYGKDGITPEDIEKMCDYLPAKIVSTQQAFKDDVSLSNAHYILKDRNIEIKLL